MNHVDTPQTRCQVGVARGDITPPVGIYHRMWGAAVHDKATGVHRPLLATLLWLHVLARKNIQIGWGYYFKVGIVLTVPVLLVTLAALALRLSVGIP